MKTSRNDSRLKRHRRLRKKVIGTAERPRLQFSRTLHHIYAAVIDDAQGHTLVATSTREKGVAEGLGSLTNTEAAQKIGATIAERAKAKGITAVVFDTGGRQYHGRIAALAQAARDAGLEF